MTADWEALDDLTAESAFPAAAQIGGEPVWVLRLASGYRAIQERCPHVQQPLRDARLVAGETMVRCPFHNYTFKLADGRGVNCPGFRIAVFDVEERDGRLYARPGALLGGTP